VDARPAQATGRRIAEARRAKGLTQEALAAAVSLDRTALSKIEAGRRNLSSSELGRVARVLDRPLDWFLAEPPDLGGILVRDLRRRRRAILRIATKHGAHSVRVFGSVARGESDPDSDIDLLVQMKPGTSLLDQAAMLVEVRDLLGREVDIVTEDALRDRIRTRVLREAVPL
jgi:predicted nucleotidyltransferase/DNA-binding XRE family transcriptional regulator